MSVADIQTIYPPKIERASRSTGPRMATAPDNEDARSCTGGECPLHSGHRLAGELAHDTMEGSRASEIVPGKPPAVVAQIATAEPLPGTMVCVCSYCRVEYATKRCVARMDGQRSHGCCPGCFVIQSALLEDQLEAGHL